VTTQALRRAQALTHRLRASGAAGAKTLPCSVGAMLAEVWRREDSMATKSEQFRAEQERTHRDRKQSERAAGEPRLTHNQAHRVDRKATYAIEGVGARSSRKSTRGSANRSKSDSALRITARVRNASPEARAQRKSGNPT
jgi:hypothetical protein